MSFEDGGLFEWRTVVASVDIELLAEVVVKGSTIHLRDIAIFPARTAHAEVGAAALLFALRADLVPVLRAAGFERVRVTGTRLSGASPGRTVDITIDITRGAA